MQQIITPRYSEIFTEDRPELDSLIEDIPSSVIIRMLCVINAELYINPGQDSQIKLFRVLTQHFPADYRSNILKKIIQNSRGKDWALFSIRFSLEFIHHELNKFREFELNDTSSEQKINFFKAYLVIVDKINEEYENSFEVDLSKGEFFQVATWPTFIDQFQLNHATNPIYSLTRALVFFNVLKDKEDFKHYISVFLRHHQKENYGSYLKAISDALNLSWTKDDGAKFNPFFIPENDEIKRILKNFSINHNDYRDRFGKDKHNFIGLKSSPIIQIGKDNYYVSNWNFITNKYYEGLLFDFYESSGISKNNKFRTFPDFKNYIAQEITENYILKKTLTYYLRNKHSVLLFDDHGSNGFPDAYYRKGNYLYLIEIKDAYFPSKAINSLDFNEIKDAIDSKYNNDRKGNGQIIKQLRSIASKSLEKSSYEELKIKPRNFTIYPIIIYTDNFFSMPGVNRYLNQELNKRLKSEEQLEASFKNIKDLAFVNIDFLLGKIHEIPNFDFKTQIDNYIAFVKAAENRFNRRRNEIDMVRMNMPFEKFISRDYRTVKNSEYLNKVVEVLELEKVVN